MSSFNYTNLYQIISLSNTRNPIRESTRWKCYPCASVYSVFPNNSIRLSPTESFCVKIEQLSEM